MVRGFYSSGHIFKLRITERERRKEREGERERVKIEREKDRGRGTIDREIERARKSNGRWTY